MTNTVQHNSLFKLVFVGISCFSYGCTYAQLGILKAKFDKILTLRDETADDENVKCYQLSSGHKVDVKFRNDRATSIRVFGKKMYPSEIEKVIADATPEPVNAAKAQKWARDRFLCSIYPKAIRFSNRSRFVQTGSRRVVQGGQRFGVTEETYLNGMKIAERPLGIVSTPPSVHYVPTGYDVPYGAADGAVRMILKYGDGSNAYATYDLTVDSDAQPYTESVTVATPHTFFYQALANREELCAKPVAPLQGWVSSVSGIPYDAAVAAFLSTEEQQALAKRQYVQTLCAAIENTSINLGSLNGTIKKIDPDLLARELGKRIRRIKDESKMRSIEVFAMIKSKKAIPLLTSLRQNSTFRKHANWAMDQIKVK